MRSYNKLRSEFPLCINNLKIKNNLISHELQIADIKGKQVKVIGKRKIKFEKGKIYVHDEIYRLESITSIDHIYVLKNKIQEGVFSVRKKSK